ncbi:Cytosolic carboxypeptidase 1 [Frankliniella fusca]|uniref:Cytosolic carboxypeptidase 1 n=1 Tax=Frankliniella fusca TaxID=407009 RepID=A0AAE1H9F7_9NEOP|nr:Cytosolic carboxypeptidase 1 [Frankliniella fusca]
MPTSMKDSFLEQFQRNFGVTICGLDTRLLAGRVHTFWLLEGSLLLIVACIYLPTPASLLEVVHLPLSLGDLEQC